MCGDGGFSMLMGDFLSVVQMKLPVKIIVFNNSVLGFVAMEMKAGGYLTDGTELHDTNFARIAEACGITGIRVEKSSDVDEALQERCRLMARCWSTWWSRKKNSPYRRKSNSNKRRVSACICCALSSADAVMK